MNDKTGKLTYETSLEFRRPELAMEFNTERNGMHASQVKVASKATTRYWWKCVNNHEWDATLRSRVDQNNKCPYCAGRLATPENNLRSKHPEIAELFNEAKNEVKASDVTPSYGVKMHFTCPVGHDFLKSPREVIRTRGICFECNSLAFKFPELKEYYHPENTIAFEELSYGSNKKVKWLCEVSHEYEQTVSHKTSRGLGCPFCSGRYATKDNNLLLAYPEIAKEFDSEKSGTTPDKVTPKSNRNMWWNCSKGHSYRTTPGKKTREDLPYGCPFCSGYQIDETNSFGDLYPQLAKEFLTDINGVDPYKVPPGRSNVYQWKCEKEGHVFKASIVARAKRNSGCPFCSGRYATSTNNLAVVRPEEVKYFHPTKNHPNAPFDFTPYSNRKVHWICEKSHEWVATPNAKKGCAKCILSATSKIEALLRDSLIQSNLMDNVYADGKKLKIKWRNNSTLTVDILATLGDKKFAIEYDGYYFHSGIHSGDKEDAYLKDTQKTQALLDAGYHVVRVREVNYAGTLEFLDIKHKNLLQLNHNYSNKLRPHSFDPIIKELSTWAEISGKF